MRPLRCRKGSAMVAPDAETGHYRRRVKSWRRISARQPSPHCWQFF